MERPVCWRPRLGHPHTNAPRGASEHDCTARGQPKTASMKDTGIPTLRTGVSDPRARCFRTPEYKVTGLTPASWANRLAEMPLVANSRSSCSRRSRETRTRPAVSIFKTPSPAESRTNSCECTKPDPGGSKTSEHYPPIFVPRHGFSSLVSDAVFLAAVSETRLHRFSILGRCGGNQRKLHRPPELCHPFKSPFHKQAQSHANAFPFCRVIRRMKAFPAPR